MSATAAPIARVVGKRARVDPEKLRLVISGGQAGADYAALVSAERSGIATGGVAPPGFVTVRGARPELETRFHLTSPPLLAGAKSYARMLTARSRKNVDDADATLAFYDCDNESGTAKTMMYCACKRWQRMPAHELVKKALRDAQAARRGGEAHRPLHVVLGLAVDLDVAGVVEFIREHRPRVLNVCGSRDADETRIAEFLDKVFAELGDEEVERAGAQPR